MGLLDRIKNLLSANINSAIDACEDESKTLKQLRQELAKTKGSLMQTVAAVMAEYQMEYERYTQLEMDAHKWETHAQTALQGGREDLAKGALIRKAEAIKSLQTVQPQLSAKAQKIEQLKLRLQEVAQSLNSVDSKIQELETRVQLNKANESLQSASNLKQEVQRIENKVARKEAYLSAQQELNQLVSGQEREYLALQQTSGVEGELARIKAELGMIPQPQQLPQSLPYQQPQAPAIPAAIPAALLAEQLQRLEQEMQLQHQPASPAPYQQVPAQTPGIHIKSSTNISW